MPFRQKHYVSEEDYWHVREFFRALYAERPRPSENWHIGQFDYWRWHWLVNVVDRSPHELLYWVDEDSRIVSVLAQGDPGVCHPMVDPRVASVPLRRNMVRTAESEFRTTTSDGRDVVFIWSDETDVYLNPVLEERGFAHSCGAHAIEHNAWLALSNAPAAAPVPAGYAIRSMGDVNELQTRNLASWRAFHPGEPDDGAGSTGDWYRNIQQAPLYRRDLDVVAIAESGDIVSFSVCYFDDVSRTGVIVLVGTAPPHQRRGLGRAVVTETLRRLYRFGALGVYVSWCEAAPGALYESCGFTDQEIGRAWQKSL